MANWLSTRLAAKKCDGRAATRCAAAARVIVLADSSKFGHSSLARLCGLCEIDLLVVDGPPADEEKDKHARYPAVPFVRDHLAQDYTIMLHDIIRAGEQEILIRWEREYKLNFERRYRDGFIGVGRSRKALTV